MSFRDSFSCPKATLLLILGLPMLADARTVPQVVIDPGHGGKDEGIQKEGYSEKDLALKLARSVGSRLSQKSGYRVVFTRKEDDFISFDERRKIANTQTPAAFLTLHFSAAPTPEVRGTRIFVMGGSAAADARLLIPLEQAHLATMSQSVKLATLLAEELKGVAPEVRTQFSQYPLAPLIGITVPAVLMEVDFLTQPGASQWKDERTFDLFAEPLARGIERFFSERTVPVP